MKSKIIISDHIIIKLCIFMEYITHKIKFSNYEIKLHSAFKLHPLHTARVFKCHNNNNDKKRTQAIVIRMYKLTINCLDMNVTVIQPVFLRCYSKGTPGAVSCELNVVGVKRLAQYFRKQPIEIDYY